MGIFAFGLERIGLVSVRAPVFSLIVLIAVTATALLGILRVTFDDDLRRLFRSKEAIYATYERLQGAFPTLENQVIVVAESSRPFTRDQFAALRDLHLDLQFVSKVSGVASIFSLREPADTGTDPTPLFPADLPDGGAFEELIGRARANPQFSNRMLSNDLRAAMIYVSLSDGRIGTSETQSLLDEVGALSGEVAEAKGLRLTTTGSLAIRQEIKLALKRDLYVLTLVGLLVAVAVCTLFFRRPKLVVIASLPPAISVAWVIGGFGLFGLPITTLNNVLPTLVMVIAFSDSVHLVQAIRRKIDRNVGVSTAVREAVLEVGPACAMTSITTMVACLSLALSIAESVREFAVAGTFAIFLAFLSVVMVVPALAVLMLKADSAVKATVRLGPLSGAIDRLTHTVQGFVNRRWQIVAIASLPLLAVTGLLYFKVGTDYDYRTYLVPESPANRVIDLVDAKLGGANAVYVLVEDRSGRDSDPLRVLRVLAAVEKAARGDGDFRSLISLSGIVNALEQTDGRPGTGDVGRLIDRLPRHVIDRLMSKDRNHHLVTLFMPARSGNETRRAIAGLDDALAPVREQYPDFRIDPTGIITVGAFASEQMINGLKQSLAAAVLVTMLVIAISLRSGMLALVSAIPNLLSLTIVAAALYLVGGAFQIVSVLALTIAFGIAVDNTIHLLNRFRLESVQGDGTDALEASVRKIGPVLIATTLILSSGFGVTQFSDLPMVQIFGRLCIFVLITALGLAVIVLPALMMFVRIRLHRS